MLHISSYFITNVVEMSLKITVDNSINIFYGIENKTIMLQSNLFRNYSIVTVTVDNGNMRNTGYGTQNKTTMLASSTFKIYSLH